MINTVKLSQDYPDITHDGIIALSDIAEDRPVTHPDSIRELGRLGLAYRPHKSRKPLLTQQGLKYVR